MTKQVDKERKARNQRRPCFKSYHMHVWTPKYPPRDLISQIGIFNNRIMAGTGLKVQAIVYSYKKRREPHKRIVIHCFN